MGPRVAEKLAKLGIHSIQDLLFHLPTRYQDRTRIVPLNLLRPERQSLIEGVISSAKVVYGKRMSLCVWLHDGSGVLMLRFFHFNSKMKATLSSEGKRLRCFGDVRFGANGFEMIHPEFQQIDGGKGENLPQALTPIYATTEGLGQLSLRRLIVAALAMMKSTVGLMELVSDLIIKKERSVWETLSLADAIQFVHSPPPDVPIDLLLKGEHPAIKRLAFEELLAHQLAMAKVRRKIRRFHAPILTRGMTLRERLQARLGFELTVAQKRVIAEVDMDLSSGAPMMRLVQGDVGCGKTVVAAMAMCPAVAARKQAVMMVPTEVLAEQHYHHFKRWFSELEIEVVLLRGKLSAKARRESLQSIASGQALIVIGTHALFQDEVSFASLGLVVIDEQHRFGVDQRYALCRKGVQGSSAPHQLIMTATPIPRTMAMTAYAELDYSVIDRMPKGRKPIKTVVLANNRRDEVIARVAVNCESEAQAYWVCTLIEESEALQAQAAEATADRLRQQLPNITIGLIHGRMSADEKDEVMSRFKLAEIDLLVATTVIEVGVDVANANLMVIENAERLGLAQLHQLRGRVGRGSKESFCVLMYQPPLSSRGQERLSVLRDSQDGFVIAEKDLSLRGAGEFLGTKQTGMPQYRVADLFRDGGMLPEVQTVARDMMQRFPERGDAIIARWLSHAQHYGQV